jgi:thiol-disulfide isomerase/thioredoxin
VFSVVLALSGAVGCASDAARARDAAGPRSVAAPEITATYVTGSGPRTILEARGRVVIVDFWTTYCDPCTRAFRKYEALMKELAGC